LYLFTASIQKQTNGWLLVQSCKWGSWDCKVTLLSHPIWKGSRQTKGNIWWGCSSSICYSTDCSTSTFRHCTTTQVNQQSFPITRACVSWGFSKFSSKRYFKNSFFSLNVATKFDQSFQRRFGANSINKMRAVVAQAQPLYYWPSLTVRVRINVVAEGSIAQSILADQNGL